MHHRLLPLHPMLAPPPHDLIARSTHFIRRKRAILRRIPFLRHRGTQLGQTLLVVKEFLTERTAAMAFRSVENAAFPLMGRVFRANPPHFPAVVRQNIAGSERTVARVVPLRRDVGKQRGKRITGVDRRVSTKWAGIVRTIAILRCH